MFRSLVTRTVLPLLLASGVVAYIGLPYIDRLLTEWFRSDIDLRADLVMKSIDEPVADLIDRKDATKLKNYLNKMTADQRLLAILICRPDGSTVIQTDRTP